jgi:hypothetical protein
MVSGAPLETHWVLNIQRNPGVRLAIGNAEFSGNARVLSESEQPLWDTVCRMACEKYGEPEPWGTPIEITVLETLTKS